MNGTPSGFHNAPVTKAFSIAAALLTVVYGVRGRSSNLGLCYEDVFGNLRLWKCFASAFAFSSTPELVFGLYLLYYFRVFERQLGSNKYAIFILFSMIVSLLLEILLLTLIRDPTISLIPGPYGLIFSSFVQFFIGIPISLNIYIFGVCFTDKSFLYLAGVQLLLSSWKKSLLAGICGVLAGFLYHLNICYIRHLQFPECVASLPSRFSWPSEGLPHSLPSSRFTGDFPLHRVQPEANYPLPAPTPGPPEDSVAALVAMGFDRSSARHALMAASNDINMATNILLGVQP